MTEQVIASRMMLQIYKQKTVAARKGHELLKRKCDALKQKFQEIMKDLLENKKKMGDEMQEALLMVAKAEWAAGQFGQKVRDSVKRATARIDLQGDNIAGVMLPRCALKEIEDQDSNINQIGLDKGGHAIQACRQKFRDCLENLIKIAGLQTSFFTLDKVIKVTNRRVNALEHVVVPRLLEVQAYIEQELDELSREEYFRLKKVLANKNRDIQEELDEKEKQEEKLKKRGIKIADLEEQNIIEDKKDKDILF